MRPSVVVYTVVLAVACKQSASTPPGPDAGPLPDAAPAELAIGGRVGNLIGHGLQLALDDAETVTIDADGTFAFVGTRRSGAPYEVSIVAQPTGPDQVCTVRNGEGVVGSVDVTSIEVECAVGTLRITELSSCYFANFPCWFEIHNTSATEIEQLSDYHLRASALPRAGGVFSNHEFVLPALAVPAGGYVIVRGRTTDDLVDGANLVNLVDAGLVPHWPGNGFVELLKSGKTVDFVRFGSSAEPPTTIGWIGAGASAVPSSAIYGSVLARDLAMTDTNLAGDWVIRGFGTPGGPNDITSDADADADGIPDQAELAGGTFAGLDLYAMGVRAGQRDLLIQIDYMAGADPGLTPRRTALDRLVAAFAANGIAVHPDVGSLFAASFDPASYNLGGGNALPFTMTINLGELAGGANHYALKAAHMDVRLQAVSHYMVFAHSLGGLSAGAAGIAEVDGNDLIIALGGRGLGVDTVANTNRLENYQAATMMHELGHNLGLRHGGDQDGNYKPNYLSIMNYLYSFNGLPTIGTAEGDRYLLYLASRGTPCGVVDDSQLTHGPSTTTFVLDFSGGTGDALNEAALDEAMGLRRPGSTAVDFDCSGAIGTTSFDLDGTASLQSLTDHDDWANLTLAFQRGAAGIALQAQVVLDPFTDERRPSADERGFSMPR